MLRRCRRRRVLRLLSQCSPLSTVANPRTRPRRSAHGDIRSFSHDPVALARRRGATAARALFELPFQCSLLRLHSNAAESSDPPPQPAHDDSCSSSQNPAEPKQQLRGAAFDETPDRDAASYAATVGHHLKHHDLPRAEALFREAPAAARGLHLDTVMLGGYVRAGLVDRARELFDGMPVKNVVAWTSMISGYCRAGRVDEARRLFDVMPDRNVFSWTAMVKGYANNGRQPAHDDSCSSSQDPAEPKQQLRGAAFDETPDRDAASYAAAVGHHLKHHDLPRAEALFRAAPAAARGPHLDTVMLGGYVKAGLVHRARELFDGMPVKNVVAWTCMVSGYCRAGRVDEARQLFDVMPDRNVFSWTAMVQGYASNGMLREAREMFDRMPERNVVAWTIMVKAYADSGQIQEAWELFDSMAKRNTYSWNAMISGFLSAGEVDEAVQLFERMPHRNVVSWTIMVTGLAKNGFTSRARELFDKMPAKDTAAWNAMITGYANNGQLNEAQRLFDSMLAKDLVTWNTIIEAYSKNERKDEAINIFLLMRRSAVSPNICTLISILVICQSTMEVKQIHGLIVKLGLLSETDLGNALLTMYSRSGDLLSAWLAFKRMEVKDTITWTSIMQVFANHGCGYHALQGFAQMLRHGYKPSSTTFTAILSACSHVGLVEKGRKMFKSIYHVYGVDPTIEHYSCLVDLLGRAGYVREAKELVDNMQQGMRDEAILGTLLGACMMHNEVEVAREVGEDLVRFEPSDSGRYTLLANVFASHGMWDQTANVWKIMRGSKTKKTPGFSQIEVNMRNHVFYSRDQEHPQCAEIYEMLNDTVVPQMKGSSCVGFRELTLQSDPTINQA